MPKNTGNLFKSIDFFSALGWVYTFHWAAFSDSLQFFSCVISEAPTVQMTLTDNASTSQQVVDFNAYNWTIYSRRGIHQIRWILKPISLQSIRNWMTCSFTSITDHYCLEPTIDIIHHYWCHYSFSRLNQCCNNAQYYSPGKPCRRYCPLPIKNRSDRIWTWTNNRTQLTGAPLKSW